MFRRTGREAPLLRRLENGRLGGTGPRAGDLAVPSDNGSMEKSKLMAIASVFWPDGDLLFWDGTDVVLRLSHVVCLFQLSETA